jgi:Tfp pilus assembly protein PilP
VQQKRRKTNRYSAFLFFLAVGVVFPSGMAGAQSTQEPVAKIEKETPPTTQEKGSGEPSEKETAEGEAAEDNAREGYFYDPTNKVDPFKSFIIVRRELEEEREREEPRTYLETLDLSQLTITAIAIGRNYRWALVKDSKGEGHVIKIGTPIGRKRGEVVKILEKEVVVREHDTDYRGNAVVTDITLKLPEAD